MLPAAAPLGSCPVGSVIIIMFVVAEDAPTTTVTTNRSRKAFINPVFLLFIYSAPFCLPSI